MFYRNTSHGAPSSSRYVRGADGSEHWYPKTSSSFSPTAERKMSSKYNGTCKACGQSFSAGTEISWSKAAGAKHVSCPAVQERAAAKASAQDAEIEALAMAAEVTLVIETLEILLGADRMGKYGESYARLSGSCFRCGRLLTDEDSIDRGLGKTCAGKVELGY